MEEERAGAQHGHIRITLTTSIVSSVIVAVMSAGITWGTFSARLAGAERELQTWKVSAIQYEARNAAQDTEIAVVKSQYGEILRRLENIDKALSPASAGR